MGLLGEGGMGEVRRIRDPELNRYLAMKIIHERILKNSTAVARFIEEGQYWTAFLLMKVSMEIRGMAGNMQDWTASVWREDGPRVENHRITESMDLSDRGYRVLRGGGWRSNAGLMPSSFRSGNIPGGSDKEDTIRLSRSVPKNP